MRVQRIFWDLHDDPEGNVQHIAEHGIGVEEVVFRTKGIPPLFTHWWHLARSAEDSLWGLVIGTPDLSGSWKTCSVSLNKTEVKE